MKSIIKKYLLRYRKNIIVDGQSDINYNVINSGANSKYPCRIIQSKCHLRIVNEGSNITEARCYGNIRLGSFVSIAGPGTVIKSLASSISIGNYSSIGQNVCIIDFNHCFEKVTSSFINHLIFKDTFKEDIYSKGEVVIEEDVWIGSNSIVLPGIRIGRGSIIGGGSVVTRDIPQYSIAYGNPAKVKRKRFDSETILFLEKLKWWEWDINKISKNREFLNVNISNLSLSEWSLKIQ